MSLPAGPRGANDGAAMSRELTRLKSEPQFKPLVYLNGAVAAPAGGSRSLFSPFHHTSRARSRVLAVSDA